jgi:hypothetical protein
LKYGVEIETSRCDNWQVLRDNTVFGVKPDGSISGLEFVSPILYGDQGFDAIREICAFASSNDWRINNACGLHVHVDMRSMTENQLFAICYAYLMGEDGFYRMVKPERRGGEYSGRHGRDAASRLLANWRDATRVFDRSIPGGRCSRWFAPSAYVCHQTFEIRVHHASLDADEICNWVRANLLFIDRVKDLTADEIDAVFAGDRLAAICNLLGAHGDFYQNRFDNASTHGMLV